MNYMPEVLKLLGVEVEERFNVVGWNSNPYYFDRNFTLRKADGEFISNVYVLVLLRGEAVIEKLPWIPKRDEKY